MWFFATQMFRVMVILALPTDAFAARVSLTPEQKQQLETAQHIAVNAIALTEKGEMTATSIAILVSQRLEEMGYSIVDNPDHHDPVLKVKCEERKTWLGPSPTGGNSDMPGSPSRLWKGPACLFTYFMDGRQGPWEYEVRTPFEDALKAAQAAKAEDTGAFALRELQQQLQYDDFPLLLSAHWHQTARLVKLLQSPETDQAMKLKIMSLTRHLSGTLMIPALQEAANDPSLAEPAIHALGYAGQEAIPFLIHLLDSSTQVDVQAASARALGEIGSRSGKAEFIPHLLQLLSEDGLDLKVQTEIVRTLGKIPDQRSIKTLKAVNVRVWTSRSEDPELQKLREATDWSLWQINPSAHTDD